MDTKEIIESDKKFIINTYGERPLALVRGKGTKVWDTEGKEYLDLFSGIGVNLLGHGHPQVIAAIKEQAEKLIHASNLYYTEPQVKLAKLLSENSFGGKCFFSNSGAEANEAAIKLARKYAKQRQGERYEIITARGSFHGRTLATLSATAQARYQKGFEPLPRGFKYVPFNDIEAVKQAVNDKSCALMLEPIQGEGGDHVASGEYLTSLRKLSDEHGLLLIFDEVQCGLGRTGKLFAYQHAGVEPDIMTLAKPLGGGLPLGAMLAREEVAAAFQPGNHASTFGGNPVACAAGVAVMETLLEENLLKNAVDVGNYLQQRLQELKQRYSFIVEVRGRGLMSGIELNFAGKEVVRKCLERGLLINCTAETFIRFLPPLIVTREEIEEGVAILDSVLKGNETGDTIPISLSSCAPLSSF
ncbi:acetylornithine transaminase [candidate division NPL-UPA2 bacterium]|nr:acetylornithine transaminase [candidate division NPL-UPA2 bacterium]